MNEEVAKAFVMSVGRYETLYWNNITWTQLVYTNKDVKILDVAIYNNGFKKWFKNGLKPNDWNNYCELKMCDPNIRPFLSCKTELENKKPEDLTYVQVMNKLNEIPDIKISFLGVGQHGLDAVIYINASDPLELYKRQMDIVQTVMKLPLSSIGFIADGQDKVALTYYDRERHQVLMFMNKDEAFDFPPADWPKMAKKVLGGSEKLRIADIKILTIKKS